MKVLEIMGSLHRGGAETMIMNYYRAFDKEKCQMDFVIHRRFENDYSKEAIDLGAKIIETISPGKVGIYKYIKNLIRIIKINGPYDAIHIHTDYQAFLAVIAGKIAGINKIIVHSHTTNFSKIQLYINRIIFNIFKVKKIACGKVAGDAFFGKKSYVILNNAIDLQKFSSNKKNYECIQNKKEIFGKAFVIGHLGRFTRLKNHEFIIELAEKISKLENNIIFACYGEGEDELKIKELVKEKNINNIRFMGITKDVTIAYNMFDIFILPSLAEGFPVTLIESQVMGVYSIASDRVSRECDLKIGMLEFLPLKIAIWEKEILKKRKEKYNVINNKEIFNEYDANIQWKKLYQIYLGEV